MSSRTRDRTIAALIAVGGAGLIGYAVLTADEPVASVKEPTSPNGSHCYSTEQARIFAHTAAQEFVRRRLRAPATAEFPWQPAAVTQPEPCVYDVVAHVDAQNGFGALLRTNYAATVRYIGRDGWELVDLVLAE